MSADSLPSDLFTPEELARLERLHLQRHGTVRGEGRGEWRSRRHGNSGLFADHRAYVAGDELRYVDWNVYGRTKELFVKRFEAEENVSVLLCVDRSRSMEGRKAHLARRIAGALGYLAIAHLDHARLAWLPARSERPFNVYRHRGRTRAFLHELAHTSSEGATDHVRDLARVVQSIRGRGLSLLISDFFDPGGAIRGLALLRSRGLQVGALHIVDEADAVLPLGSAVVAVDRETGESLSLDVTPALQNRVRAAWLARATALERWCLGREIRYQQVDAHESLWVALRELLSPRQAAGA